MSNQFIGEIRAVGFSFPPKGWASCDGQLLPISQNTALFSLLGTFYGGDGKSTFGLPNLQGSVAISQGQLPGGSDYFIGQQSGVQSVTLIQSEIPAHTHNYLTDPDDAPANANGPGGNALSTANSPATTIYSNATSPIVQLDPQALAIAGASLPHNNMMPYLCVFWVIAMQGIFPQRS